MTNNSKELENSFPSLYPKILMCLKNFITFIFSLLTLFSFIHIKTGTFRTGKQVNRDSFFTTERPSTIWAFCHIL
ncbi:hypothetical protein DU71_00670 [Methanosarcina mazei]|uniref:Uncharacterized protein n=1 Tax=Methanosarcina mazei TaxID=2209 RepID=A0A0F8MWK9_METMZ|nr:hypothetical protein DU49_14535 [Methanosarcina mazei]KKG36036.1 hypothetical protein DU35_06965 [Methanosarcina mazei]KKG40132.1 hypothetical protein DU41_14620 [Methanosarcina mazei]KKG42379.1 hypothetical protein DU39_12695 [Methanosarcina mazei]KKG54745.1 hypothetical protein DU38_10815 [Methanosarcina mazei]